MSEPEAVASPTPHRVSEPSDDIEACDGREGGVSEKVTIGAEASAQTANASDEVGKPWSIYSSKQKKMIILMASAASFFSPASGQIYFPALNVIAHDLNVSNTLVNLTITVYQIMQGLAPAFIGTLSEDGGRRTAYMTTFTIYSIANVGLALQNSYAALMVLRCVQSAGSSGTVALANAVVADLVTPAERGTYVSWISVVPQVAASLGPVIGGLLAQYVGWHFIFWFLLIMAVVVFLPMLLFFPETCRKIVDDGSVPPPNWMRCFTNVVMERKLSREGKDLRGDERDLRARQRRWHFPNSLEAFVLLFRKEVGFSLVFSALVTSGYYAVTVLIPSQFAAAYGFKEVQISLCYIPLGMGSMFAALIRGPAINSRFRHHAERLGISVEKNKNFDLSDFPIERARLEVGFPTLVGAALFTSGFGWLVLAKVHLSAPLIFLFFIGFCDSATINIIQVLMIDIYPGRAGTVTASNNLLRCWIGAGATAAVVPMIDAIGVGWTGTFFGALLLVFSPGLFYIMKQGPKWRKARRQKDRKGQPRSQVPV